MASPIVDVHCHNFNGDDLPVRGFIQHVSLRDVPMGSTLSRLLDAGVQLAAPGYHEDTAKLDRLLGQEAFESAFELAAVAPAVDVEAQLDQEVEETLNDLQARNPVLVQQIGLELAEAEAPEAAPAGEMEVEGVFDTIDLVRRGLKWVKLFAKSRLDLTALLVSTFHDQVDLFCPMLVDMGASLGDVASTTMRQQVELQEKISRLSMLGLLPGGGKARIHPFVGFDPWAEATARMVKAIEKPFDVVQAAVERYGCMGVKLYPPMGWRPIGNTAGGGMTDAQAAALDEALRDLYQWCQEKQVPITAHCNNSNYASKYFSDKGFAGPDGWIKVLEAYPNLHLNLGHFGGAHKTESADGWPWTIARAANDPRFTHLYADVGNHDIYDSVLSGAYLDLLQQMFDQDQTKEMAQRLMYGSDWFMLAIHPQYEAFLDSYRQLFQQKFGDDRTAAFMGGTALNFLFGDQGERQANQNAQRLRARYQQFAPNAMPDWL